MPRMGGLTLMATYQAELNQRSLAADTLLATSYVFQVLINWLLKMSFQRTFNF